MSPPICSDSMGQDNQLAIIVTSPSQILASGQGNRVLPELAGETFCGRMLGKELSSTLLSPKSPLHSCFPRVPLYVCRVPSPSSFRDCLLPPGREGVASRNSTRLTESRCGAWQEMTITSADQSFGLVFEVECLIKATTNLFH